jgi:hypothetical protein
LNETQKILEKSKRTLDAYKLNQKRKEGERLLELLPQGHESGLDADLLDGHHATEIVEKAVRESAKIPVKAPAMGGGGGVTDHGVLTGLTDDDHTQYFHTDGSEAMTGDLDVGDANYLYLGDSVLYKLAANTLMLGRRTAPATRNNLYAGVVNVTSIYFNAIYSANANTTIRSFLGHDGVAWRYAACLHDGYFIISPNGDDSGQAAAVNLRGAIKVVQGGVGARDVVYMCLKSDSGTYSWVQIVDGGA